MKRCTFYYNYVLLFSSLCFPLACSTDKQKKALPQGIAQHNFDMIEVASLFEQGKELIKNNRSRDALHKFQQVLELYPDCLEAHFNIGLIALTEKNGTLAQSSFEKVISLNPSHLNGLWFLSSVYAEKKEYDNAIPLLVRILELDPIHFDGHLALGRAYAQKKMFFESLDHYEFAAKNRNHDPQILSELATILVHLQSFNNAAILFRRVIELSPTNTEAILSIAHLLRYQGKMKEAIPYYRKALLEWPHNHDAHRGLAIALLSTGQFQEGFIELDNRIVEGSHQCALLKNTWINYDLQNKKVLIRAESSPEEMMLYTRYAKNLKLLGSTIIIESYPELFQLFDTCPYIDEIAPISHNTQTLPLFDIQIPAMSLPQLFEAVNDTIFTDMPYLILPENTISYWNQSLQPNNSYKIGICWQNLPIHNAANEFADHNIPFEAFIPLFSQRGITVYNLQPLTDEQLTIFSQFPFTHPVHYPTRTDDSTFAMAAVMKNMDLVISAGSMPAFMAGALGIPTWVLLPSNPHWTWLRHRTDSPWFPSLKLFRQNKDEEWVAVVNRMIKELNQNIASSLLCIQAPLSPGELLDKMTILEIKTERITDETKRLKSFEELTYLTAIYNENLKPSKQLDELIIELKTVNSILWEIEDEIRLKENAETFDQDFIKLARSVYHYNDQRGQLKRMINKLLGSPIMEVKQYSEYKSAPMHDIVVQA